MSDPAGEAERWKQRRELYLLEWTTGARYLHDIGLEATKIASEFGRQGIQAAYLLNGGALVALPAITDHLHLRGGAAVSSPAWDFTVGLAAAAACSFIAYANFTLMSACHQREGAHETSKITQIYFPGSHPPDASPKTWPDRAQVVTRHGITITLFLAVGFAVLSVLYFLFGAFALIDFAEKLR